MKSLFVSIVAAMLLATTALAAPIHDAAKAGAPAGVQAESDKGVDPNAKDGNSGVPPLLWAAIRGHTEVAEVLIASGADVDGTDKYGNVALHYAALGAGGIRGELLSGDQKGVAELLIANGADVNVRRDNGATPLDKANESGGRRAELADLLRKHGAKTAEELKAEGK